MCRWLSQVLEENAAGLALSPEKTQIAALGGDERPLVRQSAKMNRIQSAVSGGFDALGGEEILDAIQGLMRAQEALSVGDDSGWRLSPVPDVQRRDGRQVRRCPISNDIPFYQATAPRHRNARRGSGWKRYLAGRATACGTYAA